MFWHVPGISAASPVSAYTFSDHVLCKVYLFDSVVILLFLSGGYYFRQGKFQVGGPS